MRHAHGGSDATYDLAIVQAGLVRRLLGGSRAGGLIFWLAPDAVEEEVAVALGVGFGCGVGVEVHDLPLLRLVDGPVGEACAVGVARAGKVDPGIAHVRGESTGTLAAAGECVAAVGVVEDEREIGRAHV